MSRLHHGAEGRGWRGDSERWVGNHGNWECIIFGVGNCSVLLEIAIISSLRHGYKLLFSLKKRHYYNHRVNVPVRRNWPRRNKEASCHMHPPRHISPLAETAKQHRQGVTFGKRTSLHCTGLSGRESRM